MEAPARQSSRSPQSLPGASPPGAEADHFRSAGHLLEDLEALSLDLTDNPSKIGPLFTTRISIRTEGFSNTQRTHNSVTIIKNKLFYIKE